MKTIRFWTTHPDRTPASWIRALALDPGRFSLVFDSRDPEVLIGTEHLFVDFRARWRFSRLYSPKRLAIFYAGECIAPDMNMFDYAMVFDRNLNLGDRIIRHPTLDFFSGHVFEDLTSSVPDASTALREKSGFCNFLYSNPKAHPHRDWLFRTLSNYKPVDGIGPHLNTIGNRTSRCESNWRRLAVEMKLPYKFSIASENACYPGYVTEKLLSSRQARTVPIYWGDPTVAEEFNPAAFVNANGMDADTLIEVVSSIDKDEALWIDMVSQPLLTSEQAASAKRASEEYRDFTKQIFSQDISVAKRVPEGYWTERYRQSAFSARWPFSRPVFQEERRNECMVH